MGHRQQSSAGNARWRGRISILGRARGLGGVVVAIERVLEGFRKSVRHIRKTGGGYWWVGGYWGIGLGIESPN